jgi:hypothetical protein
LLLTDKEKWKVTCDWRGRLIRSSRVDITRYAFRDHTGLFVIHELDGQLTKT